MNGLVLMWKTLSSNQNSNLITIYDFNNENKTKLRQQCALVRST